MNIRLFGTAVLAGLALSFVAVKCTDIRTSSPLNELSAKTTLQFQITDLGDLDWPSKGGHRGFIWLYDINDRGDVVGLNYGHPFVRHASGRIEMLPDWMVDLKINHDGTIAGNTRDPKQPRGDRIKPFVWVRPKIEYPEILDASGKALKWKLEIIGTSNTAYGWFFGSDQATACKWQHGKGQLLPLRSYGLTTGSISDINSHGDIVGYYLSTDSISEAPERAFIWPSDRLRPIVLSTRSRTEGARASSVNDSGVVVGTAFASNQPGLAVKWVGGRIYPLSKLDPDIRHANGTEAVSINNKGYIVGTSWGEDRRHATLWTRTGPHELSEMLTQKGWKLTEALKISNRDEIIGYGVRDGKTHAVLLTPVTR